MNAAILNADLPISVRMKRANRRGWMLDRRDNIKFLVQGAQAYRQLAAQLAWEGTFEQNRNHPAPAGLLSALKRYPGVPPFPPHLVIYGVD